MKMKEIIWTPQYSEILFKEDITHSINGIKTFGVVMPQGVISRNRVLYDWDNIKKIHKSLINYPFLLNHTTEGTEVVCIGHITDSNILSLREIEQHPKYNVIANEVRNYNLPSSTEFWVYEADLNPEEEEIINKIRRGDLRHVSIQLKADETSEQYDNDGHEYTIAKPDFLIELSAVYTPGFIQTCAVLAEKYGGKQKEVKAMPIPKEDMTTTTGGGAIAPTQPLEKPEIDYKNYALSKCKICEGTDYHYINGGYIQCQKCRNIVRNGDDAMKEDVMGDGDQAVQPHPSEEDPHATPAPDELEKNFDLMAEELTNSLDEEELEIIAK